MSLVHLNGLVRTFEGYVVSTEADGVRAFFQSPPALEIAARDTTAKGEDEGRENTNAKSHILRHTSSVTFLANSRFST